MNEQAFDLEDRLVDFAVRTITVAEALPDSKAGKHVAGQLVRSGTSPAPNYGEAQAAESRKDFIHILKICLKELRETLIWPKIIHRKQLCPPECLSPIMEEADELISIFVRTFKPPKKTNPAKPLINTSKINNPCSSIVILPAL